MIGSVSGHCLNALGIVKKELTLSSLLVSRCNLATHCFLKRLPALSLRSLINEFARSSRRLFMERWRLKISPPPQVIFLQQNIFSIYGKFTIKGFKHLTIFVPLRLYCCPKHMLRSKKPNQCQCRRVGCMRRTNRIG